MEHLWDIAQWAGAGICATLIMTAAVHLLSHLSGGRWPVVRILATMLSGRSVNGKLTNRPRALLLAYLVHYGVGILFGLAYYLLYANGILGLHLTHFLLYGTWIALVAVVVWRAFFALRPAPPSVRLDSYLLVIAFGHLVFAVACYGWALSRPGV